ncbi:ATP-binding protein [Streptomyces acidicola]|uniref:ATP-binding protein n=1 Tax=Streptomyces acidicola TaxID=2596892 RepID=A0A5N8X156_9ACTN|nr:ATP-binding protein [Streptomyces acidicola]MPY53351.1 ATP-binding protein [Streptomyces acidicola]
MSCAVGVTRKPWSLPFVAEAEEVASLRRLMRLHLGLWGLHEVIDDAQLCLSELVSNVIAHVGVGTPATLAVSISGTRLRIEVHDPDTRALPTLVDAEANSEAGRGMALIDAITDRWGVQLNADKKVTWCELATGLPAVDGHCGGLRVTRAEALLSVYGNERVLLPRPARSGGLSVAVAEEAAIDMIADVLHWLWAHGCDADEALDRAQTHFEAEVGLTGE